MSRNDLCPCGSGKKWKKCHYPNNPIVTLNQDLRQKYKKQFQVHLKTDEEIDKIRKACQLAASILDQLVQYAKVGVKLIELDTLSAQLHKKAGATPAPLGYGYPPFPRTICTSLNEVICHGIPDETVLKQGDILNIDVTSILDGYYGDCSKMVCIGAISEEKQLVVDVAKKALDASIAILKPGIPVSDIGKTIEDIAKAYPVSVVNEFVGHGVGCDFHENPQIPHHYNSVNIPLAPGMIFTIEPMINGGAKRSVVDKEDKWTARTIDGKASAQWEHTVLITETGYEILTVNG
ncbi:type I methionyl aminopeptidase [Candidatus Aerophobetes bacterium]|uniref:Methionine aminopeptidase n=1 Tax=Aerophobetes bacterium TaxID=2030807 RepID=A0A2A4X7H8_UNCAE|nr:MAG: type I methionyl aminopeptidase [Candidatus Aerophobetes bacterium]